MLQMGDTAGPRYTAPKISAISYLFRTFSILIMGDTERPRYTGFRGLSVRVITALQCIMILYSYVEQVLTMCRKQEWQLLLPYFLSYFLLMVSDAVSCPLRNLKTLWYIIMILHSYVEQVLMMCRIQA